MVCSSNMNRSMVARSLLGRGGRGGLDVASSGTGAHVKLPGPSLRKPNVYAVGTPPTRPSATTSASRTPTLAVAHQVQKEWPAADAEEEQHCQNRAAALARQCRRWAI